MTTDKTHETHLEKIPIVMVFWPMWLYLAGDSNFIKTLVNFDKDNITERVLKDIGQFCRQVDFQPEIIGKVSLAAKSLCMWVRAMEVTDFLLATSTQLHSFPIADRSSHHEAKAHATVMQFLICSFIFLKIVSSWMHTDNGPNCGPLYPRTIQQWAVGTKCSLCSGAIVVIDMQWCYCKAIVASWGNTWTGT